jgi:hypothetical protein
MQVLHTSCSAASCRPLGQFPGLVLVHVGVHAVGQQHDLAQRLAVLALSYSSATVSAMRRAGRRAARALGTPTSAELAAEALGDEAGGAAGDVDVLAHQVAVDARDEVLGVEVEVLDARR